METDALEPTTQPYGDAVISVLPDSQDPEDAADILAFLHPASDEASEVVDLCRKTSPQHILDHTNQWDGADSFDFDKHPRPGDIHVPILNGGTQDDGPTQPHDVPTRSLLPNAIALRLSSRVKDIGMGFLFGRNENKCDILIKPSHPRVKVSNFHFRIFLNDAGILMIEDCSTNGTFVDKLCLQRKDGPEHSRHILEHGTKIEVITFTDAKTQQSKKVTFFVELPTRPTKDLKLRFQKNLNAHLAERAKAMKEKNANAPTTNVPKVGDGLIGTGSVKFTHGMHWDGGEKYAVISQLGRGTFAMVYLLATRQGGELFAAKEISKGRVSNGTRLDQKIENEVQIMKKVAHPHVLALLDSHDIGSHLYLILEYMPGGELSKHLEGPDWMEESLAQSITKQLCHALAYIHSHNITHRDVKPENILIRSEDPFWVELSDFGLSKMIEDEYAHLATFCGTLLYCAPEVYPEYEERVGLAPYKKNAAFPKAKYTSRVDIWSLSAVMFHLLTKRPACQPPREDGPGGRPAGYPATTKTMFDAIMNPTLVDWTRITNAGYSGTALAFLQVMLKIDPSTRPTALECLEHEWLRGIPDVASELPPVMAAELEHKSFEDWSFSDSFLVKQADLLSRDMLPPPLKPIGNSAQHISSNGLAARPRLFGEVNDTGRADSDIFGPGHAPFLKKLDSNDSVSSGIPVPQDDSAIHSTVSQIEELTVDSPRKGTPSASRAASFLKRPREDIEQFEPYPIAAKRILSVSVSTLNTRPIIGRLIPVHGSLSEATTLELTDHISVWGRWELSSHQWPNIQDVRIPRSGMEIIFWGPEIIQNGAVRLDWAALPGINAYIKTRSTSGIVVAGHTLPRQNGHPDDVYGKLRTGDIVEIFKDRSGMLAYRCEFYIGESQSERPAGEQIETEKMPAIWDFFGATLKTKAAQ